MAFKSFPVAIGSTDTDVFECPAATEAAVVLLVSNVSSSARTYTVKHYKASLDATLTVISTKSLAANTFEKVAAPISMEAGDKLIMLCSNANDIVVGGTITLSGTVQVISTFVSEGEWDSETTYTENVSIVSRSGNSYLARPNAEPNVDQDPATATDFWTLLAEKGETGDGDLSAANNLNDLADKPTAFDNIKQAATTEASGVVELATTAEYRTGTDTARALVVDQVWSAGALVGLTDGATIAVDMSTGFNFSVTLGGNRTLGNPTNPKVGQTGAFVVTQDATGSRTLAYGSNYKFAGGTAPVLSTAAGATDILFYWVQSSTSIVITGILKAIA